MLLHISTSTVVVSSKTIKVQTDQNTYRVGHTIAHGNVVVYCFTFWGEGGRKPYGATNGIPLDTTHGNSCPERER